jgi:hypothetical protein
MRRLSFLLALSAVMLSACGASPPPFGDTISECFPSRTAQVWEDVNGNGLFDEGEEPLAGVAVTMYPLPRDNRSFPTQTDEDGMAKLNGIGDFGPQCDELAAAVSVPSDYLPTTPTEIKLAGISSSEVLYFGLISQLPTPTAVVPTSTPLALESEPAEATSESGETEFFDACTLLDPEDFIPVFGTALEYELINGGAIGEPGIYLYDCMTHQLETAGLMYYSLAIDGETTSGRAAEYFQEAAAALEDGVPVNNLGEQAYFSSWDGVTMRVIVLQDAVYLSLTLSFWLEDSPENQTHLYDLARLILTRLSERGG